MAEYKECETCFHRFVCGDPKRWGKRFSVCPGHVDCKDVVPKSEFDRIYYELERLKRSVIPTLKVDLQRANTLLADNDIYIDELINKFKELEKKYMEEN